MPMLPVPCILIFLRSGVSNLCSQNSLPDLNLYPSELSGGRKRIWWLDIKAHNSYYLHQSFLLGQDLSNPTRMSDWSVRAYWKHWYKLEQSGKPLSFKRVGQYREDEDTSGGEGLDEDEEDQNQYDAKEGGENTEMDNGEDEGKEQPGEADTPKGCRSNEDKIKFLQSLLPEYEDSYHAVVTAVAAMEVCLHFYGTFVCISHLEHLE